MNDFARFEMKFYFDNPLDCALWAALEPLIQSRRAGQMVKGTLARTLLAVDPVPEMAAPPRTMNGLSSQAISPPDGQADNAAAESFLNMFG